MLVNSFDRHICFIYLSKKKSLCNKNFCHLGNLTHFKVASIYAYTDQAPFYSMGPIIPCSCCAEDI